MAVFVSGWKCNPGIYDLPGFLYLELGSFNVI